MWLLCPDPGSSQHSGKAPCGLAPPSKQSHLPSLTQPATRAPRLPSSPGDLALTRSGPPLPPLLPSPRTQESTGTQILWSSLLKSCSQPPRARWNVAIAMPPSLLCSPSTYPGPLACGQCGPGGSSSCAGIRLLFLDHLTPSPSLSPSPLSQTQLPTARSSPSRGFVATSSSSGRYSFCRLSSSHEEPSEFKPHEGRKWVRSVRPKIRPQARGRAANLGKKSRLRIHLPNLLGRGRLRLPPPTFPLLGWGHTRIPWGRHLGQEWQVPRAEPDGKVALSPSQTGLLSALPPHVQCPLLGASPPSPSLERTERAIQGSGPCHSR